MTDREISLWLMAAAAVLIAILAASRCAIGAAAPYTAKRERICRHITDNLTSGYYDGLSCKN